MPVRVRSIPLVCRRAGAINPPARRTLKSALRTRGRLPGGEFDRSQQRIVLSKIDPANEEWRSAVESNLGVIPGGDVFFVLNDLGGRVYHLGDLVPGASVLAAAPEPA